MYKHGRKLVGDRTAKSCLQEVRVTESQFADDVAVYAASRAAFVRRPQQSSVSLEKSKGLVVGKQTEPSEVLPVELVHRGRGRLYLSRK